MDTDFIKGIIPPIVTPFTDDERLDETALRRHIDFMIDGGISGILAFGSNGEFYMLDEDEMEGMLRVILDQVGGRIPVYMGVGAIRTSTCVRIARMGVRLGAVGVSVLQPMFLKPSEDELRTHLRTITRSVPDTPVLLYNNPGRTGYGISQDIVEELAHSEANLVGMKDSSGDMTQTIEFIRRNADVGFRVMCGKDTLIYSGLNVGAVGAVCSTANYLPHLVCSIYEKYVAGDLKGALEAQFKLNPIRLMTDNSSFPVATKDLANLVGSSVGKPILPSKMSPPKQMERLRNVLVEGGFPVVVE
ncbi:MAG: dihydrodipicolinate synthase family protein [Spirochaetae bacterium HGW-Spirochaetae-2]|jgi:4-hydroxy-tetrahydrodipicolinate synthase|nr:MAG: dihydrodipicolinate synthase family protein [Spirochaetae bacterium HGW-Spirochaetae-2]